MAGVTATGFVPKTVQDLVTECEADELAEIDASLDTSPEEPIGQVNGIFAEKLAEVWELLGVAYAGMSRDDAEGVQLDNVNGLTGTKRLAAKPSYTLQTLVLSQTGTYGAGALTANVTGQPSVQFRNGFDIIVSGSPGSYQVTENNKVIGTSTSLSITATGAKFLCTLNGPTIANASTLTVITSPVVGWTSTTNPTDATLGTFVEEDTPYRLRGDLEISAVGSGNPDALRADVLNVPGVIQAFVIENNKDLLDGYGNPPHTATVVIWDGASPAADDNAVAQVIWDDKPTGIGFNGTVTDGVAIDSEGDQHVMAFRRAGQQTLYLTYTITMLPGVTLDATARAAMKTAIVTTSLNPKESNGGPNPAYLNLGADVVAEAFKSALMQAGLGVKDITDMKLGFTSTPSGTSNLTLSKFQIAIADTGRILINGS